MSDIKEQPTPLTVNTPVDKPKKEKHRIDLILYFFIAISATALLLIYQYAMFDLSLNKEHSIFYGLLTFLVGPFIYATSGQNLTITWDVTTPFAGIPTEVLIGMINVYTLIYGGVEGTSSLGRSISLPSGVSAPMPEYKLKRFRWMILAWAILALLVTIFQAHVSESQFKSGVNFNVQWVYYGLASALTAYIYARQAPNIGHGMTVTGLRVTEPSPIGGASAQTMGMGSQTGGSYQPFTPPQESGGGNSGW